MFPQAARPLTYPQALHLLARLPSNRDMVKLFPPTASRARRTDANAASLPEFAAWLTRAGYPPATLPGLFRAVHIAGTKGKGTVATLASSILQQHVGPVGLYTSPHVVSPRERISVDGRPLTEEAFARFVGEVWDRLGEAAALWDHRRNDGRDALGAGVQPEDGPGFFRFMTLVAVHAFAQLGCRDVVIECGIGGEYDPTNVLPAEAVTVAVVTHVGIDHVGMLGRTVEQIAWHKSGIFKAGGVHGLTRRLEGPVGDVLRVRGREKGLARLEEVRDEDVRDWTGLQPQHHDGLPAQPWALQNAALAAAAARAHLLRTGRIGAAAADADAQGCTFFDIGRPCPLQHLPDRFLVGLRRGQKSLPRGRGQHLVLDRGQSEWFLDGAHTADSLTGVGEWFARCCSERLRGADGGKASRVLLVFNQQEPERDGVALLGALLAGVEEGAGRCVFDEFLFTRNEEEEEAGEVRDLSVQMSCRELVKRRYGSDACASVHPCVGSALTVARRLGEAKTVVLVTGSFHLVGAVLRKLDG